MENTTLSKRTVSFGLALAAACVINAIIVVVKEKSDAVMGAMKKVLGHHWTTHSALIVVLFLVLGGLLGMARGGRGIAITTSRFITTLVSAIGAAALIIIGFYLFVD
ncbi:conserved hypothetical protein [Chthoniobacter flavus Ellin428]|uniref:Uncharacterized protein n=1 Tax=Chthoniobacter flavus Ellin428 TaxID=497964 RepID=B4DAD0_9BACT|nr:hypothetical protein [Chthoniobacter flavus]EDY16591.1 conserved hypothetical protein [Chthoniobacter flavus Ellin428]TCO91987.1 hypothetical protein EV701_107269 [Chthoniobacter flavus]